MAKIAVIGAGSWGTAVAIQLSFNPETKTTLWVYEEDVFQQLSQQQQNIKYLPGVQIPHQLEFSLDLEDVVKDAEIIFNVVPSHIVRGMMKKMKPYIKSDVIIVSLSKGIENDTLMRMSEVIHQETNIPFENIVVLSGPSHAEEVARNIPTALVSASVNLRHAERIQQILSSPTLRIYTADDVIGTEVGGSVKNVIAIASGICDGAGFGDNTKAALITRGLAEITRLGVAMGAQATTFAGLSGIGDLVVTCMSKHSRNRYVGEEIGRGKTLSDVLDHMNMVAEGVKTTRSVFELSRKFDIEMPISQKVYEVLFNEKDPIEEVTELMLREPKREQFGQ
ncbi:MAG: NAD(P)H-dependent glycerol-3-phosphate dehydrogenase [Calditrichia bacterium]